MLSFKYYDCCVDDHNEKESQRILAELENIDDECDQKGSS